MSFISKFKLYIPSPTSSTNWLVSYLPLKHPMENSTGTCPVRHCRNCQHLDESVMKNIMLTYYSKSTTYICTRSPTCTCYVTWLSIRMTKQIFTTMNVMFGINSHREEYVEIFAACYKALHDLINAIVDLQVHCKFHHVHTRTYCWS